MKNVGKHKRRMLTLVSGFSILSRADHSNSLCDIKGVLLGPLLGLFQGGDEGIRVIDSIYDLHIWSSQSEGNMMAIPYMFASYP